MPTELDFKDVLFREAMAWDCIKRWFVWVPALEYRIEHSPMTLRFGAYFLIQWLLEAQRNYPTLS